MTDLMTWVNETKEQAANPQHEWDRRALKWSLNKNSVVVEIGAYKGRWALQIAERYNPNLYLFEPQGWAFDCLTDVLSRYQARTFNYALGTESGQQWLGSFGNDGATLLSDNGVEIKVVDVTETILPRLDIDLMLINIEGYEYELIPYLIECGVTPKALMVQFHAHADPSGIQLFKIVDGLNRLGYQIKWSYGFTLTAWERAE